DTPRLAEALEDLRRLVAQVKLVIGLLVRRGHPGVYRVLVALLALALFVFNDLMGFIGQDVVTRAVGHRHGRTHSQHASEHAPANRPAELNLLLFHRRYSRLSARTDYRSKHPVLS